MPRQTKWNFDVSIFFLIQSFVCRQSITSCFNVVWNINLPLLLIWLNEITYSTSRFESSKHLLKMSFSVELLSWAFIVVWFNVIGSKVKFSWTICLFYASLVNTHDANGAGRLNYSVRFVSVLPDLSATLQPSFPHFNISSSIHLKTFCLFPLVVVVLFLFSFLCLSGRTEGS